ncbi:2Fe-2S iron-sulfur cluster-binding protein [Algoriphagus sp. CAU 1675]|uniref:2Fe-2S iron-sulfur cluster-binding protein n=1 Tax=Algoriphagus sp. CAU 1675 TaxID=3032597 RepID=UPI0023DBBDF6|nr:2Fe-2S iron-sulfur cluster-binding protein [Algoriphagus sp. CAU 1675]MDF2158933.1 2Fe-2S iron-sulfur cluster-binding protein [Algoriphagus sp. CAU 1675]
MPKIVIENLFNHTINSETTHRKVIELIHENGIDWMHACGKKGRCTSCKIILTNGGENLGPVTDRELFFVKQNRLKPNERLSCQAVLEKGEIRVRVADINKFPHIEYSF